MLEDIVKFGRSNWNKAESISDIIRRRQEESKDIRGTSGSGKGVYKWIN